MGKCGTLKIREGIVGKGCLRCGWKQVSRGRFLTVSVVWGKDWRAFASAAAGALGGEKGSHQPHHPMHMELTGSRILTRELFRHKHQVVRYDIT
jgi:hypothetical protein